jgi:3-isopropylmalate/(R)-2-methylmalate dehydratase small subunit
MQPFTLISGRAAPLLETNINTDVIIRIERQTDADRTKLGPFALEALRYLPDGKKNPDFPFNQPKYQNAPILIAGRNFGCGSSRESAVWALMAMGVRCVIAESFGDIFYGNCFQNGMLPIRLPDPAVQSMAKESLISDEPFRIDLEGCVITSPSGGEMNFEIDALRRDALLLGLDEIGVTQKNEGDIIAWQIADRHARPWIWNA